MGALVSTNNCSPLADPVPKLFSYRMNSRNLRLHHLLLRNQFLEKMHVFGAGRQEKLIYIGALRSSELIATYLRSLVAIFRSILACPPHGSLFENFDDCPKIGADVTSRNNRGLGTK